MVTNEKTNSTTTIEAKTSKWQNVINRLKTSIKPSKRTNGLASEFDYYHKYVYATKFEDTVETYINDLSEKAENKA